MDIRKAIEKRRKQLKLSQYKLAKDAGMTRQAMWAYLKGKNDLNATTLGKVLDVLGLELRPKE